MTVFILEPSAVCPDRTHAVRGLIGHTRVLLQNSMDVSWVVNKESSVSYEPVEIHRIFQYTIYDEVRSQSGINRRLSRFIKRLVLKAKTYRNLKLTLSTVSVSNKDHILVPTTDWILFQAIMKWLQGRALENTPCIHLLMMYEIAPWMTGGYPYLLMIKMLNQSDLLESKLFVYTETRKHAENLSRSLGITVRECPYPLLSATESQIEKENKDAVRIGSLGGGRRDKGFDKLAKIIIRFRTIYTGKKRIEFVVQQPREMDRLSQELNELCKLDQVVILENQISDTEYQYYLDTSDIMIFPYNQKTYFARGSGIVCEAVAAGCPIIVTRNTALQERISHGNGLAALGVNEIAGALCQIIADLGRYTENAKRAREEYRNMLLNNAIVKNIGSVKSIRK